MQIKTSDLYCTSYIFAQAPISLIKRFAEESGKEVQLANRGRCRCAEFIFCGDNIGSLEQIQNLLRIRVSQTN